GWCDGDSARIIAQLRRGDETCLRRCVAQRRFQREEVVDRIPLGACTNLEDWPPRRGELDTFPPRPSQCRPALIRRPASGCRAAHRPRSSRTTNSQRDALLHVVPEQGIWRAVEEAHVPTTAAEDGPATCIGTVAGQIRHR